MSDRFDITLERKLETKPGSDGDDGGHVRRLELITGTGRRRRRSSDDKARIVMASFAPGATVSDAARRHGLSPQQLFAWRREARAMWPGRPRRRLRLPREPFQPTFKLREKRREGAVKRHPPATPYERALAHPKLPKAIKRRQDRELNVLKAGMSVCYSIKRTQLVVLFSSH